ncbi:B12-binding domain-containing protein [Chloroflexota bacterium]
MSKEEILQNLRIAMIDLDDDKIPSLLNEGVQTGLTPMEMILDGLGPGLKVVGDEYANKKRFMSDLMISGQLMNEVMEKLLPAVDIEKDIASRKPGDLVMVIGTVEGDLHDLGKKIVTAFFAGYGIKSIDIGLNKSADDFIAAIKKYKPDLVGASAIIGPVTPYCGVIHKAMVDAGVRDDVIYITGGWNMTPEWCDAIGADTYGEDAADGLEKVKLLLTGELPKWKDRVKA